MSAKGIVLNLTGVDEVFVVERGVYHERYISGVYLSAASAMKAHPVTEIMLENWKHLNPGPGWRKVDDDEWDNGCDMQDTVVIFRFKLKP